MKILITGATGYIGHKLTEAAIAKGYYVHILTRDLYSEYLPVHTNITTFKGDVTDKESVITAMKGCDRVLHAAGITKFCAKDNYIFYKVNVEGTKNMLDAALSLGVKKFVFTSTGAVSGPSGKYPMTENDPRIAAFENDYEISKHWAEELIKEYSRKGLFAVIVAAPRVYGPGIFTTGNVFDRLLSKILSIQMAFVPSQGEVVANYAFIDDVINGHFLALDHGLGGEKYILGGENLSYNTFFKTVLQCAGKKIWLIHIPQFLLVAWSFFHKIIHNITGRETNISPITIKRLLKNRALSSDKAIKQLGYTITPFAEGISKTIIHLKNKKNA